MSKRTFVVSKNIIRVSKFRNTLPFEVDLVQRLKIKVSSNATDNGQTEISVVCRTRNVFERDGNAFSLVEHNLNWIMGDWRPDEETLSAIHPYIWFQYTNLITIRRTDGRRVKGLSKSNTELHVTKLNNDFKSVLSPLSSLRTIIEILNFVNKSKIYKI